MLLSVIGLSEIKDKQSRIDISLALGLREHIYILCMRNDRQAQTTF